MPSRRTVLGAGAAALAAGVPGCSSSADPPASQSKTTRHPWPTAGYDPAGTGHRPAGPRNPTVKWTRDRESFSPVFYGFLSTPVVANGQVYVAGMADEHVEASEFTSQLLALNTDDGSVVWKQPFEDGVSGAPAVTGETVVVGDGGGRLHALRYGSTVWSVELGGRVGTPTVYGDRIYVATSLGNLHAVGTDGSVEWRVHRQPLFESLFGDPDPVAVGMPAVDERGVYLAVERRDDTAVLLAYDHGGAERWQYDLESRYGGHRPNGPAVADGTVYATAGGTVHAVDAVGGTRRWRFVSGADTGGPPTTDGTRVYVAAKNLYALSAADGTEQWRVVNSALPHYRESDAVPYVARPPVAGGQVYLRAGGFDAADGTRRWGDDAEDWLDGSSAYSLDPYRTRPMAQPVVTDDAMYLSHTHRGVQKFA